MSADAGLLGSVDANRGDLMNGWDTDEFPTDVYQTTMGMLEILKMGGFTTGGLNFDAKIRRNSTDMEDLFIAHIGGMDCFAKGLKLAAQIRAEIVTTMAAFPPDQVKLGICRPIFICSLLSS